jgi:Erythronolide synthase docking domain
MSVLDAGRLLAILNAVVAELLRLKQRNRDLEAALRRTLVAETALHREAGIARTIELHDPGRGF